MIQILILALAMFVQGLTPTVQDPKHADVRGVVEATRCDGGGQWSARVRITTSLEGGTWSVRDSSEHWSPAKAQSSGRAFVATVESDLPYARSVGQVWLKGSTSTRLGYFDIVVKRPRGCS